MGRISVLGSGFLVYLYSTGVLMCSGVLVMGYCAYFLMSEAKPATPVYSVPTVTVLTRFIGSSSSKLLFSIF